MRDLLVIYSAHFKTSLAMWAQFRVKLVIWIACVVIEPIIYITVWTQVTRVSVNVQGYSAGDFVAYYLVWMLVRHVVIAFGAQDIAWRIRNGLFSDLLLRPVHPIHGDVAYTFSYKIVSLPFLLLITFGLALVFRPTFDLQWWHVLAFFPALILATVARFLFHWTLGLIAFWITQADSIFRTVSVAEIFLAGRLAPLSLLPGWAQGLALLFPFWWLVAFPVELLLGKLSMHEVLIGLGIQMMWLLLMIGLLRLLWRSGIRRYSAVGA